MTDDKGNRWIEDDYDGYGIFGGKDYYELLAEMNGKQTRSEGIDIEFNEIVKNPKFPNLNETQQEWKNEMPENCEYQGFFYR
jgi:hypothetical protein